jgi:hypothetical protein
MATIYTAKNKPPVGAKVTVNPVYDASERFLGVVFEVDSHARTNVILKPLGGADPRKLRAKPEHLLPAAENATTTDMLPYEPPLPHGTVFTVKEGALPGVDGGQLFVVLGHNGPAYKACELGGTQGDRYWPKVARAAMNPIPAETLVPQLKALLAVFA